MLIAGLPPLPPPEGMHVMLVHFPVALLLTAPVLMAIGMFVHKKWPGISIAAWIVLLLGTIATWVAVTTGETAYLGSVFTPAAQQVVDDHRAMGHMLRNIFTALCIAYALVLLAPAFFKKLKPFPTRFAGTLIVLVVYGWAALQLANAAHEGGRLVHQYGVLAPTAESAEEDKTAAQPDAAPATPADPSKSDGVAKIDVKKKDPPAGNP